MKYRKEIDGLRAVALVPVLFSHAGFAWFRSTHVMIDLFFVLSAYLITSLIAKEITLGSFSILRFYERRARRLLPALFVMMWVSLPFAWIWLIPSQLVLFGKSLIAVPLFSSNFLFWSEASYFNPVNKMNPLLQTWSLSVEEQFYLLFPWVFLWIWPKGKKNMIQFLVFLSLISLVCLAWGARYDKDANWYLLPGRAWQFALGAALALLPERSQEKKHVKWVAEFMSLFGFGVLLVAVFNFDDLNPFFSLHNFLPFLGIALVIRFADSSTVLGKILGAKPFAGVGLISYGVFIWHQPVFAFARLYDLRQIAPYVYVILIAISFFLAYLSYHFVEAPFRNLKFLRRNTFLSGCGIIALGFIALGYWIILNRGFPGRFDVNEYQVFSWNRKLVLQTHYFVKGVKNQIPFDEFLKRWQKLPSEEFPLKRIPIAIYGDSFASDVTRALKLNGRHPLHIGGECSKFPNEDSYLCQKMFEEFKTKVKNEPYYEYIAVIQRHGHPQDVTLEKFRKNVEFWKKLGKRLIIVTEPPQFPQFQESIIRGKKPLRYDKIAKDSLHQEIVDYLNSENVILVDSMGLFCSLTTNCDYMKSRELPLTADNLLFIDSAHFTPFGDKEFGRVLLERYSVFR